MLEAKAKVSGVRGQIVTFEAKARPGCGRFSVSQRLAEIRSPFCSES